MWNLVLAIKPENGIVNFFWTTFTLDMLKVKITDGKNIHQT